MHVIFIPYGERRELEIFFRDLEAQKFLLPFDNGKGHYIHGAVRMLPFGFVEYVFPKEYADQVLHTLDFKNNPYGALTNYIKPLIRKFLKCEKIPKYKEDKYFLWIKDHISVIPIGVRYDGVIFDKLVNANHEAL